MRKCITHDASTVIDVSFLCAVQGKYLTFDGRVVCGKYKTQVTSHLLQTTTMSETFEALDVKVTAQ